jgi:beta-phosphoglucomutase
MKKLLLKADSIIFDMDGVITHTMPDHYRSWRTVLHRLGVPVTHNDIYRREGQRGIQSIREILDQYQRPFDEKKAWEILREKERHFKRIVKTRFISGARTLIKRLHKNKFRLALVTGTSRHEMRRILPEDWCNLFAVVITGSDVCNGKPHPEPYLQSLAKLCLKPSDAVAIENAPLGIQAAKKAGLRCLALETSLPEEYLKEADAVFYSIKELERRVQFVKKR